MTSECLICRRTFKSDYYYYYTHSKTNKHLVNERKVREKCYSHTELLREAHRLNGKFNYMSSELQYLYKKSIKLIQEYGEDYPNRDDIEKKIKEEDEILKTFSNTYVEFFETNKDKLNEEYNHHNNDIMDIATLVKLKNH